MKQVEIKGIIPPVVTPMNPADESVNIPELRNQIERQIAGGVHGIFPFGTNGEAYILSMKEKEEILEAAVDQVKGRIPVYAGTGCISTADTVRLSRQAQAMGRHVDIPIVLYNIPARTGNKLLPETVAKLAKDVDVIMGAKDSSGDLDNLKAYIDLTRDVGKDFAVLAGNDGNILPCLKAGGAGGVAGRANLWPRTIASIYDYFVAGDLERAQAAQDAIVALQRVFKFGNPNTIIKKGVALLGYPAGDCRRPFHDLCDEGMAELRAVLAECASKGLC